MLHREFHCKFEADGVTNSGRFKGYASVFGGVDDYGDTVLKGAFAASLAQAAQDGRLIPLLWQHNRAEPIGKPVSIKEDDRGLAYEGQLFVDFDPLAKRAAGHIQEGSVGGMSIGYREVKTNIVQEDNEIVAWELVEVDLREVSVVTMPADLDARIDEIKSIVRAGGTPTPRELEMILRESVGLSKNVAQGIASLARPVLRKREAGEDSEQATRSFFDGLRKAAVNLAAG